MPNRTVRSSPQLNELLTSIVRWAVELLRADGGAILLYDPSNGRLRHSISYGLVDQYASVTLAPGESMAGRVYQSGETMVVRDYRTWEGRSPAFGPEFPAITIIETPLRLEDQIIGVLSVDAAIAHRTFSEDDVRLAMVFASVAAVALENARLYDELQSSMKRLRNALWQEVARGTRALAERSQGLQSRLDTDPDSPTVPRLDGMLSQVLDLKIASHVLDRLSAIAAPEVPGALTPREREVLRLVTQGLSNKEIAAQIGVTTRTARAHVSNILAKLGAADRTQAAVLALRYGLLAGETTDSASL
jgi:DNA-binding CsgD family transcriptional regulator